MSSNWFSLINKSNESLKIAFARGGIRNEIRYVRDDEHIDWEDCDIELVVGYLDAKIGSFRPKQGCTYVFEMDKYFYDHMTNKIVCTGARLSQIKTLPLYMLFYDYVTNKIACIWARLSQIITRQLFILFDQKS